MSLEHVLTVLRWTLLILSFSLMALTARGFALFGWGHQRLHTFVSSVVCLYSLSIFAIQSGFLLEGVTPAPPSSRLAASLIVSILASVHAFWVLAWLRRQREGQLRLLSRHMGEVMAIVELAEVAPELAERLADEARRQTADCVVSGRCSIDGRN